VNRGCRALAAVVFQAGVAVSQPVAPATSSFELSAPAEVIVTIAARCDACAWEMAGREAVTLTVSVDDRYAAHLPLVRQGLAEYRLLLGRVGPGRHTVRVQGDPELTAAGLKEHTAASVARIDVMLVAEDQAEHLAISLAPFLYARPNTVGRFTDVPVFMWYEREPTDRGMRYRYSVIFTNEDGGTPADRLMATWGRTTDIEYVYSVEVDASGRILAEDFQGPDHKILSFGGKRDGLHPMLWVSTDNNMVRDSGTTTVRYAPAPVAVALDGVSREAVMDANPWLYAVAAQELAREGKIADNPPPGRGAIPDPRRFVYVEACGDVGEAAIAFEVRVDEKWERSDRGVPEYRIARDGCFRGAVPIPPSAGVSDIRAVRIAAYSRPKQNGRPSASAGTARIDRVNTVFMLDERHLPRPPLLSWTGPALVRVGGPPLDIPVGRP
jgi:hypothetical protein